MRVMMAKHMKRSARGMGKNDDSVKRGEKMFERGEGKRRRRKREDSPMLNKIPVLINHSINSSPLPTPPGWVYPTFAWEHLLAPPPCPIS